MKVYTLLNIILCYSFIAFGQNDTEVAFIEYGTKRLSLDQPFIISVVIKDSEIRPSIIFPDIKGLEKKSKSATSSVNMVDGKKVVIQTISQEYFSTKEGSFVIPVFFLHVNGTRLRSEEVVVSFTKANQDLEGVQVAIDQPALPYADVVGRDVFLSVQSDKKKAYLREGFALRISLYIAENAPVEMEFYRFNEQLQAMLKKLRPANCWEENVGIEEIVKRRVSIKGKGYTEYNMYQGRLFPLTSDTIILPSVSLDMLVVDNSNPDDGRTTLIKTFRSTASEITVEQLPLHPLRDQVAVGQYTLSEKLSSDRVYPGESVRYLLKIQGQGNIAAIPEPVIPVNSVFDFYMPEVSQVIKRSYQSVTGEKAFDYFIVPKKDGTFPLKRYFQWVYFDPVAGTYDTLRSSRTLRVMGEDYKLNLALGGSLGLYDNLDSLDSSQVNFDFRKIIKNITNAVVVVLLIMMVWVLRK